MAQKRQIRELSRSVKRFPVCRETIDKGGWIPHILCDRSGAYWDGLTAIDGEGKSVKRPFRFMSQGDDSSDFRWRFRRSREGRLSQSDALLANSR
jgi:hypothetical protein